MKLIRPHIFALVIVAFASSAFAIEGLKLSIHCPHVWLSWPSTNGETYLVQYRATLDTNSSWITLTNFMPPASGTNLTLFVHSNRVDCPVGQVFGMMSMSGGESVMMGAAKSSISPEARKLIAQEREESRLAALFEKCKTEGREPFEWELKNHPPLPPSPEEIRAKILKATQQAKLLNTEESALESFGESNGPLPQGSGGGGGSPDPSCGFYRVVRNGIHLFGVTNGMVVSDIIYVPVEVGLLGSPGVISTMLDPTDDAQPDGVYAVSFDDAPGIPTLTWDTARTTNGVYQLKPIVILAGGTVVTGRVVSVTVSNRIQLRDWSDSFGWGFPISAVIASNNAPYQITIENDQGMVVRTLTGTATGYSIEDYWDGLDELGNDATQTAFIDVSISYNPLTRRRVRKAISNANLSGQWLIANQNLYSSSVFINNLNQINTYAALNGGTISGNRHVIHSGFGDWITFLLYLREASCRSLYYFGHGSPGSLGFGNNDPDNGVSAGTIARLTGNTLSSLTTTNDFSTNKVFRFVFLDGCTTGSKGSTLAYAFGIEPVVRSNSVFSALGLAPRAFVGWKKNVYTGPLDLSHSTFVLNFFEQWTDVGDNLTTSLNSAATGTIGINISGGLQDLQIWGSPELERQ